MNLQMNAVITPNWAPLSRPERVLFWALLAAFGVGLVAPAVPQISNYHAFADQRMAWGVPYLMDVLTNLPFAILGMWGLLLIALRGQEAPDIRWSLAGIFFGGLVVTSIGSTFYHWQPDNWGLAWDRIGMVVAFAGLLGLACADRISPRGGVAVAILVMLGGPLSVATWYLTGNLLPWVVVQGGGMLMIVILALMRPVQGAWNLPLGAIIALYGVAKLLELGDHAVFEWTQGLISGHSLKHMVAAMAAIPVLIVMHNGAHFQRSVARKSQ